MGNPLSRFFELIRNPSYSRTVSLLGIVVVALSIPLTVFVAQQIQETRQRAASSNPCYIPGTDAAIQAERDGCFPVRTCGVPNEAGIIPMEYQCRPSEFIGPPGKPCGNQGGECRAGVCVVGPERDVIDPNGSVDCGTGSGGSSSGSGVSCTSAGYTCVTNEIQCEGKTCTPKTEYTCSVGVCYQIACVPTHAVSCNPACGTPQTCGKPSSCVDNCGNTYTGQCDACTNVPGPTTVTPPPSGAPASTPKPLLGFPDPQCTTGDPICASNGSKAIRLTDGSYACPNPSEGPTCPTSTTALPACDVKTVAGTCTPKTNTCNGEGTQTVNYLTRTDGKACQERRNVSEDCPIAAKPNNCTAGNTCTSGKCVGGGTQITFTIGLDGLGKTGDVQSRKAGRNEGANPVRFERGVLYYEVFDPRNVDANGLPQRVRENFTKSEKVNYDSSTGKFKATADLGTLTGGNYIIKVRVEGYLAKIIRDISITSGQTANVSADLITGDVDRDNKLTILDHNIIISQNCYGKGAAGNCQAADLDDNGTVNEFDYNLFLREFTSGVREGDQLVAKGE